MAITREEITQDSEMHIRKSGGEVSEWCEGDGEGRACAVFPAARGKGYLGTLPTDPFTGSNETWQVEKEDAPRSPQQAAPGIVDVHSGSNEHSLEGTPYSSW